MANLGDIFSGPVASPAAAPYYPPVIATGGGNDGLGGIGGGLLLGAMLGGGIGGFGGRDHGHHHVDRCNDNDLNPFVAAILSNLNQVSCAVPTTALETQGEILGALNTLALGVQQGFSSVKDSVQNAGTANLIATNSVGQAVQTSALQTVIAIGNDGDKTRAQIALYHEGDLQRQLAVAESALARRETDSRLREVEVNVNQTVNQQQVQAQAQLQQQQQAQFLAGILAEVRNLSGDIQAVKQGQVIFNSGTMAASGTQAAANTKVA
jgi:hypothetical protein